MAVKKSQEGLRLGLVVSKKNEAIQSYIIIDTEGSERKKKESVLRETHLTRKEKERAGV